MPIDAVPIQDASIRAPWTRIRMLLAVVKPPTSANNFASPVASYAVSWNPTPLSKNFDKRSHKRFLSLSDRLSSPPCTWECTSCQNNDWNELSVVSWNLNKTRFVRAFQCKNVTKRNTCTRVVCCKVRNVLFKPLPAATRRLYGVLTRSNSRPWTTVVFSLQNLHVITSSLIALDSNWTAPSCCKGDRKRIKVTRDFS